MGRDDMKQDWLDYERPEQPPRAAWWWRFVYDPGYAIWWFLAAAIAVFAFYVVAWAIQYVLYSLLKY